MGAGMRESWRPLLAWGRIVLVVAIIGVVTWSVLRPTGGDQDLLVVPPRSTSTPAPTELPTTYPTPDFTLPSIPPMTEQPIAGKWDFVGASANLFAGLGAREAIADVERLAADSSVIGLNEVTRARARQLGAWADTNGWSFFSPTSPTDPWQGFNAVLVNTKVFKVLDQGVVYGSAASMPSYKVTSRWITWTLLQHKKSKTRVSWVQTHMDGAVEAQGRPRRAAQQRVRNNLAYMKVISTTVEQLAAVGEVVVGGDLNVDAAADSRVQFAGFPYVALMERNSEEALPGLRSVYADLGFKRPSTSGGGSWIDYLLVWKKPVDERVLTFKDYRILAPVNSDHNPVQAVFTVTR